MVEEDIRMTKLERLGNVLCWAFLLWVLVWICLFAIPGFVDRCSRHEATWAGETRELPSVKLSEGD
jgi:hypothetical protein